MELIELTYYDFTFQKKIMQEKSNCTCHACQSIREVDLKFINHFGSFALQNYSGNIKPLGSDVNLVHRLLKNSVSQRTNIKCYTLFSDNCIKELGLPQELFTQMIENYEHFGKINTYVSDLSESYKRLSETKQTIIEKDDADFITKYQFQMPPAVLWDWLVDNSKRELWMEGLSWEKGERPAGRTGAGATNHCIHGKDKHLEVILDWKPFEYYTYESGSKLFFIISTIKFIENENGTELNEVIKLKSKLPEVFKKMLVKFIALKVMKVYDGYKKIEELEQKEFERRLQAENL